MHTYEGVLRNNQIEWQGEPPPSTAAGIRVRVTLLDESKEQRRARGAAMAAALDRMALRQTGWPEDPIAWQREMRKDRELPGRD